VSNCQDLEKTKWETYFSGIIDLPAHALWIHF